MSKHRSKASEQGSTEFRAEVFLSYATKDHLFAEIATMKLAEEGFDIWRDRGQLRAGIDWRLGIDEGIARSIAIIIALSEESSQSPYVTYEWAYALGKGKPIIPVKLNECSIHPRLQGVQLLDFSIPGSLPWAALFDRIKEIETDQEAVVPKPLELTSALRGPDEPTIRKILSYLDERGYQMASFDRIRRRVDEKLSDQQLIGLIERNPSIFRSVDLQGGRPGLGKLLP